MAISRSEECDRLDRIESLICHVESCVLGMREVKVESTAQWSVHVK